MRIGVDARTCLAGFRGRISSPANKGARQNIDPLRRCWTSQPAITNGGADAWIGSPINKMGLHISKKRSEAGVSPGTRPIVGLHINKWRKVLDTSIGDAGASPGAGQTKGSQCPWGETSYRSKQQALDGSAHSWIGSPVNKLGSPINKMGLPIIKIRSEADAPPGLRPIMGSLTNKWGSMGDTGASPGARPNIGSCINKRKEVIGASLGACVAGSEDTLIGDAGASSPITGQGPIGSQSWRLIGPPINKSREAGASQGVGPDMGSHMNIMGSPIDKYETAGASQREMLGPVPITNWRGEAGVFPAPSVKPTIGSLINERVRARGHSQRSNNKKSKEARWWTGPKGFVHQQKPGYGLEQQQEARRGQIVGSHIRACGRRSQRSNNKKPEEARWWTRPQGSGHQPGSGLEQQQEAQGGQGVDWTKGVRPPTENRSCTGAATRSPGGARTPTSRGSGSSPTGRGTGSPKGAAIRNSGSSPTGGRERIGPHSYKESGTEQDTISVVQVNLNKSRAATTELNHVDFDVALIQEPNMGRKATISLIELPKRSFCKEYARAAVIIGERVKYWPVESLSSRDLQ